VISEFDYAKNNTKKNKVFNGHRTDTHQWHDMSHGIHLLALRDRGVYVYVRDGDVTYLLRPTCC